MNMFSIYNKNEGGNDLADSLAAVFAYQEIQNSAEQSLPASQVSDSAVQEILTKFPSASDSVEKSADKYSWKDAKGHTISVEKNIGGNEFVLSINHNFSGSYNKASWNIADADGKQSLAFVVDCLVKNAELLETAEPSLVQDVDDVLSFIQSDLLAGSDGNFNKAADLNQLDWAAETGIPEPKPLFTGNLKTEIDKIVSDASEGKNLTSVIEKYFGPDHQSSANEEDIWKDLQKEIEEQAHNAADKITDLLVGNGMTEQDALEESNPMFFKILTLLQARGQNILELAFERIGKKTNYSRRNKLLQEHLNDSEHSKLRNQFAE